MHEWPFVWSSELVYEEPESESESLPPPSCWSLGALTIGPNGTGGERISDAG